MRRGQAFERVGSEASGSRARAAASEGRGRLKRHEKWLGESLEQLEKVMGLSESEWRSDENGGNDVVDDTNFQTQDTPPTDTTDASAMSKKKRSLEQLDEATSKKLDAVTDTSKHPAEAKPSEKSLGEPEKKRPRDSSEERSRKAEKVSGFGLVFTLVVVHFLMTLVPGFRGKCICKYLRHFPFCFTRQPQNI